MAVLAYMKYQKIALFRMAHFLSKVLSMWLEKNHPKEAVKT